MTTSALPIRASARGFQLIEMIVVIAAISVLMSVFLPALAGARYQARAVVCMSNIRQLGLSFQAYANNQDGYAIPGCGAARTYWWGQIQADGVDRTKGILWPYMGAELKERGVFECPAQPLGTYKLQGRPSNMPEGPEWITSTYGYNGYYLCPPRSGWRQIANRPWQRLGAIKGPDQVIVFADTLLSWGFIGSAADVTNTALLDPPYIYNSGTWRKNLSPTTCFRHHDRASMALADGHCEAKSNGGTAYAVPEAKIGSVGTSNAPHYVPDYLQWVTGEL